MPNVIKISVENPDEIRNSGAYDITAVVRLQWSATQAGAFADVSGTGSTPTIPVLAATNLYTGYDPAGTSSTFYRTRYENAGATRTSDWTPAFQVGDETSGLLCSIYDVSQRMFGSSTVSVNNQEIILDIIREVSADIESYVGCWLAPRPTDPTSTMTLNFDVGMEGHDGDIYFPGGVFGRELVLRNGQRTCGIRTLSALGIAFVSQPETGGLYTAATLADVQLRPRPSADGPANRLVFLNANFTGGVAYFYQGYSTVQVTGSFGYASVPYDIQSVAISAVTRRFLGKESAAVAAALGPDGSQIVPLDISPAMRATLNRYRVPNAA